jgi:hypothetical protein
MHIYSLKLNTHLSTVEEVSDMLHHFSCFQIILLHVDVLCHSIKKKKECEFVFLRVN